MTIIGEIPWQQAKVPQISQEQHRLALRISSGVSCAALSVARTILCGSRG